jgi:hypothetical protein
LPRTNALALFSCVSDEGKNVYTSFTPHSDGFLDKVWVVQLEVTNLLGNLLADGLGFQVGYQVGHEPGEKGQGCQETTARLLNVSRY